MENLFKDKQRLLRIYFVLLKLSYVFTVASLAALFTDGFEWIYVGMMMTGLMYAGIQTLAAHHAEKMINRKNYLGLLISVVLNMMILPSLFFWLSLIGLYVLLNKEIRESFPADQNPKWVNDFFRWLDEVTGTKFKSA